MSVTTEAVQQFETRERPDFTDFAAGIAQQTAIEVEAQPASSSAPEESTRGKIVEPVAHVALVGAGVETTVVDQAKARAALRERLRTDPEFARLVRQPISLDQRTGIRTYSPDHKWSMF
jgi:hypothetical protein